MKNEIQKLCKFTQTPLVNKAFDLAYKSHLGQTDKAGRPYIEHAITVANGVNSEDEVIVALLHDIVEDTSITFEILGEMLFPDKIIDAVRVITKIKGEDYHVYLDRVKQNEIARIVKIVDMTHNSDLSRLPFVTPKDEARRQKYLKAIEELSLNIPNGTAK